MTRALDALPAIYIADGHHRSAAAAGRATARRQRLAHSYFFSVMFPQAEMTILDYNRVVRDLNGRTPTAAGEIGQLYTVEPSDREVRPRRRRGRNVSCRPLVPPDDAPG